MSVNLSTIFGSEINVVVQPRDTERSYAGFPGAHGLVGMHMGSRGYPIIITGRLASSGASYQAARGNLQVVIDGIENYLWVDAADYSFKGTTYYDVVFEKIQLVPDNAGKVFHFTSEGYVTVDFVCSLRALV